MILLVVSVGCRVGPTMSFVNVHSPQCIYRNCQICDFIYFFFSFINFEDHIISVFVGDLFKLMLTLHFFKIYYFLASCFEIVNTMFSLSVRFWRKVCERYNWMHVIINQFFIYLLLLLLLHLDLISYFFLDKKLTYGNIRG